MASLNDIPAYMKTAQVAIEDHRFCEHSGVDWRTTLNAVRKLFSGGSGGGSTLTQQLIKNITDENDYSILRKVREIFTALNMEKKYSKQQILEPTSTWSTMAVNARALRPPLKPISGKA